MMHGRKNIELSNTVTRNKSFEINRLLVYCRLDKVTLRSGLIDSLLSHCRYHMLCPAHPVL